MAGGRRGRRLPYQPQAELGSDDGGQAAWLFGQGFILFTAATTCLVAAAHIFFIHQGPDRGVRAGLWFAAAPLLTLTMVTQLVGMGPA